MTFESWLAFTSIALLATATPGPAALLVTVVSLSAGVKKSLLTILGNVTGLLVMSGMSVLGLSAVLLHSTFAFTVIKLAGAAYLVFMGIKLWKNGLGNGADKGATIASRKNSGLYIQGILVALTNPKAIVFTTALFPQFVSVSTPLFPQFSVLVATFMGLSFVCLLIYSLLAQRVRVHGQNWVARPVIGKMLGSGFVGAGCFLASTTK